MDTLKWFGKGKKSCGASRQIEKICGTEYAKIDGQSNERIYKGIYKG